MQGMEGMNMEASGACCVECFMLQRYLWRKDIGYIEIYRTTVAEENVLFFRMSPHTKKQDILFCDRNMSKLLVHIRIPDWTVSGGLKKSWALRYTREEYLFNRYVCTVRAE